MRKPRELTWRKRPEAEGAEVPEGSGCGSGSTRPPTTTPKIKWQLLVKPILRGGKMN